MDPDVETRQLNALREEPNRSRHSSSDFESSDAESFHSCTSTMRGSASIPATPAPHYSDFLEFRPPDLSGSLSPTFSSENTLLRDELEIANASQDAAESSADSSSKLTFVTVINTRLAGLRNDSQNLSDSSLASNTRTIVLAADDEVLATVPQTSGSASTSMVTIQQTTHFFFNNQPNGQSNTLSHDTATGQNDVQLAVAGKRRESLSASDHTSTPSNSSTFSNSDAQIVNDNGDAKHDKDNSCGRKKGKKNVGGEVWSSIGLADVDQLSTPSDGCLSPLTSKRSAKLPLRNSSNNVVPRRSVHGDFTTTEIELKRAELMENTSRALTECALAQVALVMLKYAAASDASAQSRYWTKYQKLVASHEALKAKYADELRNCDQMTTVAVKRREIELDELRQLTAKTKAGVAQLRRQLARD